jgi:hypothetical protein
MADAYSGHAARKLNKHRVGQEKHPGKRGTQPATAGPPHLGHALVLRLGGGARRTGRRRAGRCRRACRLPPRGSRLLLLLLLPEQRQAGLEVEARQGLGRLAPIVEGC